MGKVAAVQVGLHGGRPGLGVAPGIFAATG